MSNYFKLQIENINKFFIDGKWVAPSGSDHFVVLDSHTEEVFASVAEAREDDIQRAVMSARRAFDHGPWPRMTHAERAAYLNELAVEIDKRRDELAHMWTIEAGITFRLAVKSLENLGGVFRYYASLAETFSFVETRTPSSDGGAGLLVREPVGVVAAIIPWNGPALSAVYKCAAAMIAGCTVILKMSPEAPTAGYVLAEVCERVGLPAGVINILTADRAVSELLVRHPEVDKVTFTGSTAAGRRIASLCGDRIARCTLELGGKSAAVILDDYDVETAAKAISSSLIAISGQVCAALTRVIVPRSKHEKLVEALGDFLRSVTIGNPFDQLNQMGPLASKLQRDRVEGYISQGKAEGAKLTFGGNRPAHLNRGFYVEPTVFANVDNRAKIAREEIFGPVLTVITADNEAHAIELANDSPYGLNSSVFTNDLEQAYKVSRQLRAGTVGHNGKRTDWAIAFGGFKQSGVGREGGTEGLMPYLETKTVVLNSLPQSVGQSSTKAFV